MTEKCGECKFWTAPDDEPSVDEPSLIIGVCRRYPPTVRLEVYDDRDTWLFPETSSENRCGEWQGRWF
jgi:hypothetical protein